MKHTQQVITAARGLAALRAAQAKGESVCPEWTPGMSQVLLDLHPGPLGVASDIALTVLNDEVGRLSGLLDFRGQGGSTYNKLCQAIVVLPACPLSGLIGEAAQELAAREATPADFPGGDAEMLNWVSASDVSISRIEGIPLRWRVKEANRPAVYSESLRTAIAEAMKAGGVTTQETTVEDLTTRLRAAQAGMDASARVELWKKLMAGYCPECGGTDPHCPCWNDE